jgi:hypothetical protein
MSDDSYLLVILALIFVVFVLFMLNTSKAHRLEKQATDNSREREARKVELEETRKKLREENSRAKSLRELLEKADQENAELKVIFDERKKLFPWLATAYADYQELSLKRVESDLRNKKRPAIKAAKEVSNAKMRAREAEKRFRNLKYRLDFYEKYFPWLSEVSGDTLEEFLSSLETSNHRSTQEEDGQNDPVRSFLSPQEYQALTSQQRNQRALDRWKAGRKSNWEIGRMYERYVGYTFEQKGYHVDYFGATQGLADFGRDLIASKFGKIEIIQCKYWAAERTIHEKHIFQLFGSVVEYLARSNQEADSLPLFGTFQTFTDIKPVFVTSTRLSEVARDFAKILKVEVRESVALGDYPIIKCNISRRNNERVYHLPFDQQYDRTVIEPDKGEFYAWTVQDAEDAGFRRAFRWYPGAAS